MNTTPDIIEETLDEIQHIFNDILDYSPDGEIASLVTHGTGKMLKLRRAITTIYQRGRKEEREDILKKGSVNYEIS